MKLNPTCIRDILIYFENNLTFGPDLSWSPISLEPLCNNLEKYTKEELTYTLLLLDEAHYIEAHIINHSGGIVDIHIYRLTYLGHVFLDTIKSETIWKKLQNAITSAGTISLPVLQDIGSNYALELLSRL